MIDSEDWDVMLLHGVPTEESVDCRFYYILEKFCVKNTLPIQTSVLVLMSYYFSSCDIFEEPS